MHAMMAELIYSTIAPRISKITTGETVSDDAAGGEGLSILDPVLKVQNTQKKQKKTPSASRRFSITYKFLAVVRNSTS